MSICVKYDHEAIDEWLDGELPPEAAAALEAHCATCADCGTRLGNAQRLRDTLSSLRYPDTDEAFARQAFEVARRASARNRAHQRLLGGALAASLVLLAVVAFWPQTDMQTGPQATAGDALPVQFVRLDSVRTISVALNAGEELKGATLTLILPEGLELDGYPGQREITWQTDLARGINLLPLPVRGLAPGERVLTARITHQGRSRQLDVPINVGVVDSGLGPRVNPENTPRRAG